MRAAYVPDAELGTRWFADKAVWVRDGAELLPFATRQPRRRYVAAHHGSPAWHYGRRSRRCGVMTAAAVPVLFVAEPPATAATGIRRAGDRLAVAPSRLVRVGVAVAAVGSGSC